MLPSELIRGFGEEYALNILKNKKDQSTHYNVRHQVYIQRFAVIGFPGVSASLNGYVANAVHNSNQKFDHQDQDLISLNQLQKYLQGE